MNRPTPSEAGAPASRRKARTVALQVLYEVDGARHEPQRALNSRLREFPLAPSTQTFARRIVDGVLTNRAEIDALISNFAPSWPIGQIAMVDRNILEVAIFELMFAGETPHKVAINEAIELGKVFGGDSSHRFINGVLGSVIEKAQLESRQ